jgi:hypothetical protein
MSTTSIRQRAGEALLRSGTELAIDQRELEQRLARAERGTAAYSSAHGAVAMARWVDAAILWLAWRLLPRTFTPAPPVRHSASADGRP